MNPQKDEKKLDEVIRCTIDTTKPVFDVDKWKRKFPEEFRILQSRATQTSVHSVLWADVIASPIVKFAIAAVIFIMIGFFLFQRPVKKIDNVPPIEVNRSPTQMISMISMRMTYQQGGFDALDKQFRDTLNVFGSRSTGISMSELLEGTNGS